MDTGEMLEALKLLNKVISKQPKGRYVDDLKKARRALRLQIEASVILRETSLAAERAWSTSGDSL